MKKLIFIISLIAAITTGAMAQITQGNTSATESVNVSVADYANVTFSTAFGAISILDGGISMSQSSGAYGTSATYNVVNNVNVKATAGTSVPSAGLTAGSIVANASCAGLGTLPDTGTEFLTSATSAGAGGTVYAWLTGVTIANSHAANSGTFNVTVTVAEG